jgi:hypothetical protein
VRRIAELTEKVAQLTPGHGRRQRDAGDQRQDVYPFCDTSPSRPADPKAAAPGASWQRECEPEPAPATWVAECCRRARRAARLRCGPVRRLPPTTSARQPSPASGLPSRSSPRSAAIRRGAKAGAEERTRTSTALRQQAPEAQQDRGRSRRPPDYRSALSIILAVRRRLWRRLPDFLASSCKARLTFASEDQWNALTACPSTRRREHGFQSPTGLRMSDRVGGLLRRAA